MGGRRTTKQELEQIATLTEEGSTTREIAERLNRSEAAIRNLRYKKHLITKAQNETKVLFQQRDELSNAVKTLQEQKNMLTLQVDGLKKEKERLESIINLDKFLLQQTLSKSLISLKQQRPELFTLSGAEQIAMLLEVILK